MLEQKLASLQALVHSTQEASESGWQALIDEDKLLARLEMLENQLHIYSKVHINKNRHTHTNRHTGTHSQGTHAGTHTCTLV